MDRRLNDRCVLKNADTVPYVAFDILENIPGLHHGFSTRLGGVSSGCYAQMNLGFDRGDDNGLVRKNFELLSSSMGFESGSVVLTNQWHTTNVRCVGAAERGEGVYRPAVSEEIDGHVTDTPGVTLLAYGADCVPIFVVDPVRRAVGICHSGWKGTLHNIAMHTVELMSSSYGCDPQELVAVIGPSICRDCFEIREDVAGPFADRIHLTLDRLPSEGPLISGREIGRYQLDLWEINRQNLLDSGLCDENIVVSGLCTKHMPELFFSHRRDGSARGSMAGFIGFDPSGDTWR